MELETATNDVITMNLTIAAMEHWLREAGAERSGKELGREIAALYREIHVAVDEMASTEDDDDDFDDEEDDEDDDDEDVADEEGD